MIDFQDPILTRGDLMFSYDAKRYRDNKPTLLIFASCHGRTLIEYFTYQRPDICEAFNLLRLETAPMTLAIDAGIDIFANPTIRAIFQSAAVIATYNMGARMRHHDLARVSKLFRPDAKVITFVAPNFSCFCPFSYDGYASHLGLLTAFDRGQSADEVWHDFKSGAFDPMFPIRWRLELGRHIDKESYHDIGLTQFIIRNHRKVKLWFGPSHPSYHVMAHIGSEIGQRLGFPTHTEEQILGFDYTRAMVGGQPETDYEFNHFKFQFPKRHVEDPTNYYRAVLDAVYNHWKSESSIRPQVD
jgi:hypothetical protein